MSAHAYTEDQLVEQPAVGLFAALGWETVSALDETFGAGGLLARETRGEVVLAARLRDALTRLNPALPADAIASAVDELTRDRSAMSLEAASRDTTRDCMQTDSPESNDRKAPQSSDPEPTPADGTMSVLPADCQQALDALRTAVAEALERKRRLGQYAVIWENGRVVRLEPEDIPPLHTPRLP